MKNRIRIIKAVDKVIGSLLIKIMPARTHRIFQKSELNKILIIRPGGMGDAALLLPVLRMVRCQYPDVVVDILCESRNAGIFKSVGWLNTIYYYHDPVHLFSVIRSYYDVIIDTEQSHFLSAIICRLLKSHYTLGFEAYGREKMFHKAVGYDHESYETNQFFRLIKQGVPLNGDIEWDVPFFNKPEKGDDDKVSKISSCGKRIVCLFPGATIKERLWPENRWAEVIDTLDSQGFQSVLIGAGLELDMCRTIQTRCQTGSVLNLAGELSLVETAWLFEHSDLLISSDSGILHLGVLANIPTVSLFGSGIAAKWAPRGEHHIVINKKMPCSPCTIYGTTPTCQYGNACMLSIKSEDVINASQQLLQAISK